MDSPEILKALRDELNAEKERSAAIDRPTPLAVSPWVAMSLLQKSIRRGEEAHALSAASTLLAAAPHRLWRRLGGIAFEDVGLADFRSVSLVAASFTHPGRKTENGWPFAAVLTLGLTRAAKCRAADDLLMVADLHPAYEADRLGLTHRPLSELLHLATDSADVIRAAISTWYATGSRGVGGLRARKGSPHAFFDHICERGFPQTLVEVCREGFVRLQDPLCPLLALLHGQLRSGVPSLTSDDILPPTAMVGTVPGWALDQYSREGLTALRRFLSQGSATSMWVRSNIAPAARLAFLGGLVFRAEGGLLRRRAHWSMAADLRADYETRCAGYGCADATEPLGLLRQDIPLLNEARADVL